MTDTQILNEIHKHNGSQRPRWLVICHSINDWEIMEVVNDLMVSRGPSLRYCVEHAYEGCITVLRRKMTDNNIL